MPGPSATSRGSGSSAAHPESAVPVASSLPETEIVEVPYEWVLSLAFFPSHTTWRLPSAVRSAPKVSDGLSLMPSCVHAPGPPAHAEPARPSIDSTVITPSAPTHNLRAHMRHLLMCKIRTSGRA